MQRLLHNLVRPEFVLGALLVACFFLFCIGVLFAFGFPGAVGDETVTTSAVLKMISKPSLTPNDPFNYHMALPAYVYLPFFVLTLASLLMVGVFDSVADLAVYGAIHWTQFVVIGRMISIAASILSLYVLFVFAKRIVGVWAALLTVFFTGTHLLFVMSAHFGQVWSLQMCALMAAFVTIAWLYESEAPRYKHYLVTGGSVACAFGMHVIGIIAAAPFFVAHFLKEKNLFKALTHRGFLAAAGIVLVAIPVMYTLNPYGFSNYTNRIMHALGTFVGGVPAADVGASATWIEKWTTYAVILWEYQPLVCVLAIIGAFLLYRRERGWSLILASFVVVYYIVIGPIMGGGGLLFEPRFILPLLPILSLYAAVALQAYAAHVPRLVAASTVVIVCAVSLFPAVVWDARIAGAYTSVEARDWVETHIPAGARIMYFDFGSPTLPLHESVETLEQIARTSPTFMTTAREYLRTHDAHRNSLQPAYTIVNMNHFWKRDFPEELAREKYDYAILAWWDHDRRVMVENQLAVSGIDLGDAIRLIRFPENATEATQGLNILGRMREPLKTLLVPQTPGPIIEIYRLP